VRPQGKGRDKQYETIYRNAASHHSSCLGRIVSREQEEDRSASDRIHDRKESAHHEQNTFGNLNQQADLQSVSRFEPSRFELARSAYTLTCVAELTERLELSVKSCSH